MFTKSELSELIGENFNQVFKPLSREELHSMGMIMFDEVQGLLDSGKKPEEIFKSVGDLYDGFAYVQCRVINIDDNLYYNKKYDLNSTTIIEREDYDIFCPACIYLTVDDIEITPKFL
jgi:hypothetical protein